MVLLRHSWCLLVSLALVGCGRIGFDNRELVGGVDGGSTSDIIDAGDESIDAGDGPIDAGAGTADAETSPPDAEPSQLCDVEELLASANDTLVGGFGSSVVPQVSVPFAPSSLVGGVGKGAGYSNGYSGSTDFRPSNDGEFNQAMAPLMNGSVADTVIGVLVFPTEGGAYGAANLSAPVDGLIITMARQIITSLGLVIGEDGGTDYDIQVTWELWGCRPPS